MDGDGADGGEGDFGKIDDIRGGLGVEGEEQFVVFAVGEGVEAGGDMVLAGEYFGIRVEGELVGVNLGADVGGGAEAGQVLGEAIGEVHHRVEVLAGGLFQFECEVDAGGEGKMAATNGAAELAGDEESVAYLGTGAANFVAIGQRAQGGDGDDEALVPNGGVAADERAVEGGGGITAGEEKLLGGRDAGAGAFARKCDGDEDGSGQAGHGGAVGEAAVDGFATGLRR